MEDYVAPEVIKWRDFGEASDWWSLGVFVFEMFAGTPPFYQKDGKMKVEKLLDGDLLFPKEFP